VLDRWHSAPRPGPGDFDRCARLARRAIAVWGPLTIDQLRRALGITSATCASARSLVGVLGCRNHKPGGFLKRPDGRWTVLPDRPGQTSWPWNPTFTRTAVTALGAATAAAVARTLRGAA
jgi:hypothetical protein